MHLVNLLLSEHRKATQCVVICEACTADISVNETKLALKHLGLQEVQSNLTTAIT